MRRGAGYDRLLACLMANIRKTVPLEEIAAVTECEPRTVQQYVYQLRAAGFLIQTKYGTGYRLLSAEREEVA
jgi:biotin operon repressor